MKKMKKILLLLLFTIASYGQAVFDEGIQIKNNTTDNSATKVNVQSTDGTINTISKSDLANVVEVNDVPSLPLVGEAGKIYVVKNVNKIYRWNGTYYQELAGSDPTYQSIIDALGYTPENVANKATNFTTVNNTLYPTTEAVINLDNTVNIKDFGAIGDGVTDNTSAIQNALDSGKTVFVPDGSFLVSSTLLIHSYQTLCGQSLNSEIKTNLNIELISNSLVGAGFIERATIKNLKLTNRYTVTAGAGATNWTVNLKNPLHCKIDNVWFLGNFADGDYNVSNKGGLRFFADGSIPFAYLNTVNKSLFDKAAIRIETSDSDVFDSYVWAHPLGTPGIDLQSSNISVQRCNGIIPTRTTGGIYLSSGAALCRIIGNFFDGSASPVQSGYAIIGESNTDNIISGNSFWNADKGGIYLKDASLYSIIGNSFRDNNKVDNSYSDIVIEGISTGSSTIIASNNTFYQNRTLTNKGYAIKEVNSGTNPLLNNYSNNKIQGNYLSPAILSTLSTMWGVQGGGVIPKISNAGSFVNIESSLIVGDGLDKSNAGLTDNDIISFSKGSNVQGRKGFPQLAISANTAGNWYAPTYKTTNPAAQIVVDGLGGSVQFNRAVSGTAGSAIAWLASASFSNAGVFKLSNLSGTGSRLVAADASGNLSTPAIPTAPTAAVGTNTTQIATTAFVQANARPYKVYTALLSQTGTNAPTATVLENTLGGTIVWTRNLQGEYYGTLTGAFTSGKTYATIVNGSNVDILPLYYQTARISSDVVRIISSKGTAQTDSLISGMSCEIRVYN